MNLYFIPIGLILLSALYAGTGLLVWGRRPGLAVMPFVWMMFSIAVWSLGYSLEFLTPSLSGKVLWARVEFFGIASVATFLFTFSVIYTGRSNLLTTPIRIFLWVIPVITILLVWTNQYHSLIWRTTTIGKAGALSFLTSDFGTWFWLQMAYSYTLVILSSVFLILEVLRSPRPYNIQAGLVLLGILFPWVGSLLYLSSTILPNIDITPFLFAPTVLLLAWGIQRYHLLGILPMAPSMILHRLNDGVIVVDSRKRIIYLNAMAEQLLHITVGEAIGQPLEILQTTCQEILQRLIERQEPYEENEFWVDGQKRFFDVRAMPLPAKGWSASGADASYLIIFRDIHQRKQVELDLRRREAIMEALTLASQQFLRTSAWETSIPLFLERIGLASEVGRAYVFQNYDGQDGQIFTSQCYEWTAPNVESQIDNLAYQHIPIQAIGPVSWYTELIQGRLVTAQIGQLPKADKASISERGVRSTVIVPIFVEHRWWGFLGLEEYADKRQWSKAELGALQAAAEIFSASETRARNENALLRRQRTLNLLHEIVGSALQTTDRQSMAQTIVNKLGDVIRADGCFLSLWEEAAGKFTPLAAYGPYSEAYLSLTIKPGEPTLTASALAAGHTLTIDNILNTPYLSHRIATILPFRAAMILPLIAGQKKFGAILLAYTNAHRFESEEISIGEQAAGLIALTLEKIYAVENASKRAEESEILRKAGATVAATLHLDEAIDRILEQLSLVVPYDSASVQLLRGNEFEIVGGRGWKNPKEVLGLRFPASGDNPNTVVLQTMKPYVLGDAVQAHSSFWEGGPHSHIRSWLGVPLIVRGKVTGLLAIDSVELNHFTNEHLQTVTVFADQVATALENARLFEEVQDLALTDALTGLYNRRGLFEIGHIEFSRIHRLGRPFSFIMIDIDHFKRVNDQYGHPIGDQVLQFLASELQSTVRGTEIVGRYGGEEFAILLSGSDGEAAMKFAERLRARIEQTPFYAGENEIRLTISLGVAAYNDNNPDLETMVARADQALYVAKHKGRNRVVFGQ
jgi:diguanylate cyclase (GGDEF)-like protein/PAS domain S-box-containing protein